MYLRSAVLSALLWAISVSCGAENPSGVMSERAAITLPAGGRELSVSADYSLAATNISGGDAPGVYIYSLPSLTEVGRIPGAWGCVAVRPDGAQVACGGKDQVVHVWDRTTASITNLNTGPNQKAAAYYYSTSQVAFSPDSQSLVIATGYDVTNGSHFSSTNWLQRYSTADLAAPHTYHFTKANHFNDIQFTPDSSKIVVGMGTKGIRIAYPNFPCDMWGTSYGIVDMGTGDSTYVSTGEAHYSISTDGTSVALTCANCSGYRVVVQDLVTQTTTLELPALSAVGRDVQLIPGGYLAVRDLSEIVVYAGATEERRYAMPLKSMSGDSFQPLGSARQMLVLESTEAQARLVLMEDTFWGDAPGALLASCTPNPALQGEGIFIDVVATADVAGVPTVNVGGRAARLVRAEDARHFTYACRIPLDAASGPVIIDMAAQTTGGEILLDSSGDALSIVARECNGAITCPALEDEGPLLAAFWANSAAVPAADWATLDVDAGGIADRFEVALVLAVICGSSGWGVDAACVFEGNMQTVLRESENVLDGTDVAQVAAAMLSVGPEVQEALRALGFEGAYGVIGGAKSLAGPFSPEGDADGDGVTNLQEYLNVLAAGGDTDEYVAAALNPFLDGTTASANALPLGSPAPVIAVGLILLAVVLAFRRNEIQH